MLVPSVLEALFSTATLTKLSTIFILKYISTGTGTGTGTVLVLLGLGGASQLGSNYLILSRPNLSH